MGKASSSKRKGKPATGASKGAVVLWGVLMDGQLGSYLFPTMEMAEQSARKLREEHPASTLEWCQVGITLLMRRPLKPKIETLRSIPATLEGAEQAIEHLVGPKP